MALVMMAMLFMLTERLQMKDQCPLLSCADVERMLAAFLPRRDTSVEQVFSHMETKNSIRVLTSVNGDSSDVNQKIIPSLAEIVELQFSEDSKSLAAAGSDCRVHIFDSQTGHEAYESLVQDKRVTMIRFSRDGQKLLTVAGDEVRLWDVRTAIELLPVLRHPETVRQVEWTADEKFVVTRFGQQIAVWQVGFDLPANEKGWRELDGLISAVSGYEIDPHEPPRKGLPPGCSLENIRDGKPTTAIVDWLANSDHLVQKISPEIRQTRTQYFEALLRTNSDGQVSRNRKEAEWLASGEPTFEAMLRQAN
jgi:WD40 repeat protein